MNVVVSKCSAAETTFVFFKIIKAGHESVDSVTAPVNEHLKKWQIALLVFSSMSGDVYYKWINK